MARTVAQDPPHDAAGDWRSRARQDLAQTADVLQISRSAAYRAIKRGQIPSFVVGRRLFVPTAALRRLLGEIVDGEVA